MTGPFDEHGPYPEGWGEHEIELWDSEPNTYSAFYSRDEFRELQTSFEQGWLTGGIDPDERENAREAFYNLTGVMPSTFDWQAYRDYLAYGYIDT